MSNARNKVVLGSYVLYTKENSIAKILAIDSISKSYTIDCNGRTIDTIDEYLRKDLVSDLQKSRGWCKKLCDQNEYFETRAKNVEKNRDEWRLYSEDIKKDRDEWKLQHRKFKKRT